MSLDALIMLAGALTALLPFLGFPNSWDSVMYFILGVFMVSLGIVVRRRRSNSGKRPLRKTRPVYAQSEPSDIQPAFAHEETAQQ